MPKCVPGCACKRHIKRERSPEHRQALSEATKAKWAEPEHHERMSKAFSERQAKLWQDPEYRANKVCSPGKPKGERYLNGDYVYVRDEDHPLAERSGYVREHRKVLMAKIGEGPQPCHWSCGRTDLEWGKDLYTDHLDRDPRNNDPDNLVPSCPICNLTRHNRKV